jgi:hypothetical protein
MTEKSTRKDGHTMKYVIIRRYQYYGRGWGQWHLVGQYWPGALARDGGYLHETRADAIAHDRALLPCLPSGAGACQTRVVTAISREARRATRKEG